MNHLTKARIKRLRLDARRLRAVADRLSDEAKELAHQDRLERARVNFFSKRAEVDKSVVLTPTAPEDLFEGVKVGTANP